MTPSPRVPFDPEGDIRSNFSVTNFRHSFIEYLGLDWTKVTAMF